MARAPIGFPSIVASPVCATLAVAAAAAACSDRVPAPRLSAVAPARVSAWADAPIAVRGADLYAAVSTRLDDPSAPAVQNDWAVRAGDVALIDVRWRDPTRLDAVVPAGLPPGIYDVTVTTPRGERLALPRALAVEDTPVGLPLSIEDAPGGAGEPIGDRALAAGDELVAYAVVRTAGGAFVADVPAHWSLDGAIGELVPADPPVSAVLRARAIGTGAIAATHPDAGDARTGEIAVAAGPPASLTIEDAPGGAGAPIGDRALTTDDSLAVYAVSRDAFGNFVADEWVDWAVAGGIGAIAPAAGDRATFDPTRPGSGAITAAHAALPAAATGTLSVSPGRVARFDVVPDTLSLAVGDPPVTFSIAGAVDADGNPTADVGTVTWSIASGTLDTFDAATAQLTPAAEGTGTVRAESSYGPADESGPIAIAAARAFVVTAVRAPATVSRGERFAIEVDVENRTARDARLVDVALAYRRGGGDAGGDFATAATWDRPDAVPAGATATARFDVAVASAAALGAVDVTATARGWFSDTGALVSDSETGSFAVAATSPPTAVISAPLPPDNKLCAGGTIGFAGSDSIGATTWAWSLPGGSPAASAAPDPPAIAYAAPGAYPFWLTVANSMAARDTVAGPAPVFVGAPAAPPYPTGAIQFNKPRAGEAIDLADDLPVRVDMAGDGDPTNLTDCAGTKLAEGSAHAYVTVFADRGALDATRDVRPSIPGIQVDLHKGTHFDDVAWDALAPMTEGDAIVYAEFRDETTGAVTAAGHTRVAFVDDRDPPAIAAMAPGACDAACWGKGDAFVVQFDEPMDAASVLAATRVQASASPNCSGPWTDITGASVLTYDDEADALRIEPAAQAQASYGVRVKLRGRDASSNGNALGTPNVCAVVDDRPPPAIPEPPAVVATPGAPVSPDGDGVDDVMAFEVAVDAATAFVRLDIERAGRSVYAVYAPVVPGTTASIPWAGRDRGGRALPNGLYVYRLVAYNRRLEPSEPAVGAVEVRSAVALVGVPPWL